VIVLVKYKKILKKLNNSSKNCAIILGNYNTSGLGLSRNLGRLKIPVLWIYSNNKNYGIYSKYCAAIKCINPIENEKEYIDLLLSIGEKFTKKPVLFPIGDIETSFISKNSSKLMKYYYMSSTDYQTVEKLLNKKIFYDLIQKLKIPHPKTYHITDEKELDNIDENISYPLIIKPCNSVLFTNDFKKKVFVINNKDELNHYFNKAISKNHDVLIQEIIPGGSDQMYGFNAYYPEETNPIGFFMYKRIRDWPIGFGNGCHIESIFIEEFEEIVTTLMKKIGYHGIIDAEFKLDPRDNKFKLIEINPRTWMQNSLPTKCGINIAYQYYLDQIKELETTSNDEFIDCKWLYMIDDLKVSFNYIKNKEISFKEWINSYKGNKEYAVYSSDDPLPIFVLLVKSIFHIL
jgi:predicted ATP-grasp superfamily ATP-dependent carboligase